ncbi:MAG: hypothetical protein HONBIEJF_02077 [Fimbriimonadaceae bacterium]|nr:hypothetical protein [Fimbriimonadaceae bacterium]
MPDAVCRVELFGNLRLFLSGRPMPIKSQRLGSLLGLMALELPARLPRSHVIEILWPESLPESGRNSLSVAVHGLRQLLEPTKEDQGTILVAESTDIGLNPLAVSTDVQDFQQAIAEGRLGEAIALYRPNLAQGHHLDALHDAQAKYHLVAIKAYEELVKSLREAKKVREAIVVNTQLIALDPFNERAHIRAIKLNLESGNRNSALEAYEVFRRMLKTNCGAEPDPTVDALVRDIAPAFGNVFVAPEVDTSDDIQATQIPVRLTKFFGRARELELLDNLINGGAKLITITGMGGIGKTRLVEEALKLQAAKNNPPALYFVSLAGRKSASEALSEIVQGVLPSGYQAPNLTAQIAAVLSNRRSILVLDNIEDLLNHDGLEGATMVESLAGSVECLTVLCTSRVAIAIDGEVDFRLDPLPDLGKGHAFDAVKANPRVQLYVDRAKNVNPEFELSEKNYKSVAEISTWLEGVPLAIELAAACARSIPPKLLLTRLKARLDLPDSRLRKGVARHRSIRAVLDSSFELLNASERLVICTCATFRGGIFQDSLDRILGSDTGQCLAQLTRCSLLRAESTSHGMQWKMLEMVREFAEARLAEEEEPSKIETAFAMTFLTQAEALRQLLTGHQQRDTLSRMHLDRNNYLRALDLMLDRTDMLEDAVRMVAALWRFWSIAGTLNIGRTRLDRLLTQCESRPIDSGLMAQASNFAGNLAYSAGEYSKARRYHERAVLHYRQEFNAEGLASALNNIALAGMRLGQYAAAKHSAAEAVATADEHGLHDLHATALGTLGLTNYCNGDFCAAATELEAAAVKFRALGNIYATANNLRHLARARFNLADQRFAGLVFEALELAEGVNSLALALSIVMVIAEMCANLGNKKLASTLFATVKAIRAADSVSFVAGDAALEIEVGRLVEPADPVDFRSAVDLAREFLIGASRS